MDAYRAAFEEQLFKNKQLMLKLAELAVAGPSRYEKAKVILKNLIHLLNDGKLISNGRMKILNAAL